MEFYRLCPSMDNLTACRSVTTDVGDVIYFHCAPEGHKLENLSGNNKVSFCVVGKTQVLPDKFATNYESVIVFGTACRGHRL